MADKEVERITQNALTALYDDLNTELAKRNGYQAIDALAPEDDVIDENYYGADPDSKARVRHFNRAMKARQYIVTVAQYSFNPNSEE